MRRPRAIPVPHAILMLGAVLTLGASPIASPRADPPAGTPGPAASVSPTPSATRTPSPADTIPGLDVEVQVDEATFVATKAIADSFETGIQLVPVRIVDGLDATVTLQSTADVRFTEAPLLCLHWRDAAPDDGGLESPCWGVPDPALALADRLDAGDAWAMTSGTTLRTRLRLTRGDATCDYPPGDWILRLRLVPRIDDATPTPLYLRIPFQVRHDPATVLPSVSISDVRFCGLASEVIRDQGVPPTATP
jgi:hypothetical protein